MKVRFFVTGMGRSGTKWLANLLHWSDPTVAVHHEPIGSDRAAHVGIFYGNTDAKEYFVKRLKLMEKLEDPDLDYAEVNSYLRYCVPELIEFFKVPVIGIVRDGRYVVRSLMANKVFQIENYPRIQPSQKMTPFESCCWYWADTYRRINMTGIPVYRLEDQIDSYLNFRGFCTRISASPNKTLWWSLKGHKINKTDGLESVLGWEDRQRKDFERMAGDVQKAYGYSL